MILGTKSAARGRMAIIGAVMILAGSSVGLGAGAANASTVFNRLYCDINTGKCYQVNPPHNSSIQNECFWQYGGTAGRNNQYTVNNCNRWGTPIWQCALTGTAECCAATHGLRHNAHWLYV